MVVAPGRWSRATFFLLPDTQRWVVAVVVVAQEPEGVGSPDRASRFPGAGGARVCAPRPTAPCGHRGETRDSSKSLCLPSAVISHPALALRQWLPEWRLTAAGQRRATRCKVRQRVSSPTTFAASWRGPLSHLRMVTLAPFSSSSSPAPSHPRWVFFPGITLVQEGGNEFGAWNVSEVGIYLARMRMCVWCWPGPGASQAGWRSEAGGPWASAGSLRLSPF